MAERKNQLSNVSFGGAWSEELVDRDRVQSILRVIERAARDCASRDVRGSRLDRALEEVELMIEKGPQLVSRLRRALGEQHPILRQQEAQRIARMIRRATGQMEAMPGRDNSN